MPKVSVTHVADPFGGWDVRELKRGTILSPPTSSAVPDYDLDLEKKPLREHIAALLSLLQVEGSASKFVLQTSSGEYLLLGEFAGGEGALSIGGSSNNASLTGSSAGGGSGGVPQAEPPQRELLRRLVKEGSELRLRTHPHVRARNVVDLLHLATNAAAEQEEGSALSKESLFAMKYEFKDATFAEEFFELGGMSALLTVITSSSGNTQAYALSALRAAMLYISGMEVLLDDQKLVAQLFSLVDSNVVAVARQALELIFVLCSYGTNGWKHIHRAAKLFAKKKGCAAYENLVELLKSGDLDTQLNAITFFNSILDACPPQRQEKLLLLWREIDIEPTLRMEVAVSQNEAFKRQVKHFEQTVLSLFPTSKPIVVEPSSKDSLERKKSLDLSVLTSSSIFRKMTASSPSIERLKDKEKDKEKERRSKLLRKESGTSTTSTSEKAKSNTKSSLSLSSMPSMSTEEKLREYELQQPLIRALRAQLRRQDAAIREALKEGAFINAHAPLKRYVERSKEVDTDIPVQLSSTPVPSQPASSASAAADPNLQEKVQQLAKQVAQLKTMGKTLTERKDNEIARLHEEIATIKSQRDNKEKELASLLASRENTNNKMKEAEKEDEKKPNNASEEAERMYDDIQMLKESLIRLQGLKDQVVRELRGLKQKRGGGGGTEDRASVDGLELLEAKHMKEDLEKEKAAKTKLQEKVDELQAQLARGKTTEEVLELEGKIKELEERVSILTKDNTALRVEKLEWKMKREKLAKEEKTESANSSAAVGPASSAALEDLELKLARQERVAKEHKQDKDKALLQLSNMMKVMKVLKAKYEEESKSNTYNEKELKEAKELIQRLQKENQELKAQSLSASDTLSGAESSQKEEGTEGMMKKLAKEKERLLEQLEDLNRKTNDLVSEKEALTIKLQQAEKVESVSTVAILSLNDQVSDLTAKLASLRSDTKDSDLAIKYDKLQREKEMLEEQFKGEIEALRKQNLSSGDEAIQSLKAEVNKLQQENEQLKLTNEAHIAELEAQKSRTSVDLLNSDFTAQLSLNLCADVARKLGERQQENIKFTKPVVTPPKKMKSLFWKRIVLPASSEAKEVFTIWHEVKEIEVPKHFLDAKFSHKSLQELKRGSSLSSSSRGKSGRLNKSGKHETFTTTASSSSTDSPSMTRLGLLDAKRAQTIAIMKSSLPQEETLKEAIRTMDDAKLTKKQIQNLLMHLPSEEELQSIQVLRSDLQQQEAKLDSGEQFLMVLASIDHLVARLKCWSLMRTWETELVAKVKSRLESVAASAEEIRQSAALRVLLGVLLNVGNYLNGQTEELARADGFDLIETLRKVMEMRANDDRATLFNYVYLFLREQHRPTKSNENVVVQQLNRELTRLEEASKASFSKVRSQMEEMNLGLLEFGLLSKEVCDEPFASKAAAFFAKATKQAEELQQTYTRSLQVFQELLLYCGYSQHDLPKITPELFFGALYAFISALYKKMQKTLKKGTMLSVITDSSEDPMASIVAAIRTRNSAEALSTYSL
ncbi:hypothetical protein QOT17_006614 [Balamuthia mandrillaris]